MEYNKMYIATAMKQNTFYIRMTMKYNKMYIGKAITHWQDHETW